MSPARNRDRNHQAILDLRRIANSQGELARAKTVLSERKVSVDTLKEEKLFAVEISRPEDEGVLRKSSIVHYKSQLIVKMEADRDLFRTG